MICKNCGAELSKEDTFCGKCGTEIKKRAIKCTECGKYFNKEFGICPFCGTELAADNIKTIDNQDASAFAIETEEIQTSETHDNEKKFVMCPMCGNRYDIDVGLCVVCGFSEAKPEAVNKESKAHKVETNANLCEDITNCPKHNKCFVSSDGNCPFCSYSPEKSAPYEKDNKTFIEKCDICSRESVALKKHKITDWAGERNANICENCIIKYENATEEKSGILHEKILGTLSKYKRLLIIALIVAIVLIAAVIIIIAVASNSGYICSQCGERFQEGKSVFGEYWCNDCFYS